MSVMLPPGLTSRTSQDVARLGLLRSRRHTCYYTGWLTTGGTGYTYHTCWALEQDFDLIRLVYQNISATPYTVDKMIAAGVAEENAAGNYAPIDAVGGTRSWNAVTANAAGANVLPPAPSGSTLALTVPGITGTQTQTYAFSDWARVNSTPATNGGRLRYLAVRSYFSGVSYALVHQAGLATFNASAAQGRTISGVFQIGDRTAQLALGASSDPTDPYITPQAVQYYARGRGATVLAIGDSLTQGAQTTGDVNSWGHIGCCAVSSARTAVSFVNGGWGGQAPDAFYLRGITEIDAFTPEIVVIETSSPNGGGPSSQAVVDKWFSQSIDLAHYAIRKGAVPILKTAVPWYSYTTAQDARRLDLNARVRTMGENGAMLVFDASKLVTDGATPERLKAQYIGGDLAHMNDAAHTVLGAEFARVLRRALGS